MRDRIINAFAGQGLAGGPGPATLPGADAGEWKSAGGAALRDATPTLAAVLVPLIDRADGMTVLLTQRTAHLNSHAGQISFPGGRVEHGDATPESTALRETEEEIGLPSSHIELVGRLNTRHTGTGYRVVPVVGLIDPPFPLEPDPGEVAEIFEVPLGFVLDPANHRLETRIQGGMERQFYALAYRDYFIWGLTARLLVNLSEVVGRR